MRHVRIVGNLRHIFPTRVFHCDFLLLRHFQESRVCDRLFEGGAQLRQYGRRHALGSGHGAIDEVGDVHALLLERRDPGADGHPLGRRLREDFDLVPEFRDGRHRDRQHRNVAAEQGVARGAAAAEGHLVEFESRLDHELAGPDAVDAAEGRHAYRDFAGVLLDVGHEVGQRFVLACLEHGERRRPPVHVAQEVEVLDGVFHLPHDGADDGLGEVRHADGVAVGLGVRNRVEPDVAARAGLVDDGDLGALAQVLFQEGNEGARRPVRAAADPVGDDVVDGALGIGRFNRG